MLDRARLRAVGVFLADRNDQVRESLRSALRAKGFTRLRTFPSVEDLSKALESETPDFLIVASNLGAKAFRLVKDVRRFKIGRNPFLMISLLLGDDAGIDVVTRALSSGADDIIMGAVVPDALIGRVEHLAVHRPLFISTADYLGPERRRQSGRKSQILQFDVVNTLRDKIDGRRMSPAATSRAIRECLKLAAGARLDSQGRKLGWACKFILSAYREKRIDAEFKKYLLVIGEILQDAAASAKMLRETDLVTLCEQILRPIKTMTDDYKDIGDAEMDIIRKLAKAYTSAHAFRTSAMK